MNRTFTSTIVAAVCAGVFAAAADSARADAADDVNLVVIGGKLFTAGGYYATGTYTGRVFDGSTSTGTTTTNPGFFANAGTFPLYTATPPLVGLRIDFVKELLFWNGTQLAAPASTLTVQSGTRSAVISGTDTVGKAGILLGNIPSDRSYHVHPTYRLQSGAPTGLYGFVATLGPNDNGAAAGFTTSEPILIAIARGSVPNIDQGMAALTQAAFVPEPASLALAAIGLAAIGGGMVVRRRRRAATALRMMALAAFVAAAATPARAEIWTRGHGDIGVAYPGGSDTEFEMEVHLEPGAIVSGSTVTDPAGIAYAPDAMTIRVPSTANLKAIQSGPTAVWGGDAAGYDLIATGSTLGVAQGADLWVLSFSDFDADFYATPFLGWATEEGFAGEGFSDVTFRPVSFTGPTGGSMGVFSDALEPLWVLLAGDSSFMGDAFIVPADDHAHKVLAFTLPGLYQIGIEASATHPTHGLVSGQALYSFAVVPEPSAGALVAAGIAGGAVLCLRKRRRSASRPACRQPHFDVPWEPWGSDLPVTPSQTT